MEFLRFFKFNLFSFSASLFIITMLSSCGKSPESLGKEIGQKLCDCATGQQDVVKQPKSCDYYERDLQDEVKRQFYREEDRQTAWNAALITSEDCREAYLEKHPRH